MQSDESSVDSSAFNNSATYIPETGEQLASSDHDIIELNLSPPDGFGDGKPLRELGDYEIVREIGRGGMGIVYEASQKTLSRRVALKLLPVATQLDTRHIQRFRNEALAAAQLKHEHIVPIFSVGHVDGVHHYAMQYIDGQNLAQVIRDMKSHVASRELRQSEETPGIGGSSTAPSNPQSSTPPSTGPSKHNKLSNSAALDFSEDRILDALAGGRSSSFRKLADTVARLGICVANALQHAHDLGIIHRDIKPSNLMLDNDGKVWVTDFGLAQIRDAPGLTKTGDVVGTLRYMGPEQASGRRGFVDHRTDIYSLGITLYEILTLRRAFDGGNARELLRQVSFERPRPLRKINSRIPEELETIIDKAIARNPSERYQTAAEFADDLQRFVDNEPILAKKPSWTKRSRQWFGRHPKLAVGMAVTLCATLLFSIGLSAAIWKMLAIETQQREKTEELLRESEGLRLIANSALQRDQNPGLALALAVAGADLAPGLEANNALLHALNANHELKTLFFPDQSLARIDLSPNDARAVVSLSRSSNTDQPLPALLIDLSSGETTGRFEQETSVTSAVFSPHGQYVLTAAERPRADGRQAQPGDVDFPMPTLWDVESNKRLHEFDTHRLRQASVHSFSASGESLVLIAAGGDVEILDCRSGGVQLVLRGHTSQVLEAVYSPNADRVATLTQSGTVRIWNTADGSLLKTHAASSRIGSKPQLHFTSDSTVVVVSTRAGTDFIPVENESIPIQRRETASAVSPVSPRVVLYSAVSGRITVINSHNGQVQAEWDTPEYARLVQFTADGRRLIVGGYQDLYVYDAESGTQVAELLGHTDLLTGFACGHDPQHAVSIDSAGSARIWHLEDGSTRLSFESQLQSGVPVNTSFDASGDQLALASVPRHYALRRSADGSILPGRVRGKPQHRRFDSKQILTHEKDTVYVWDSSTSRMLGQLKLTGELIHEVHTAREGEIALVLTDEGSAYSWHIAQDATNQLRLAGETAVSADFAPTGAQFAVAFSNGRVGVYSAPDARLVTALEHSGQVTCVRFSPSGEKLLTIDHQDTGRVWNLTTQSVVTTLSNPQLRMNQAEFAHDERSVITFDTGSNQAVAQWDITTGETAELTARQEVIGQVEVDVHPQRPLVAMASFADGTVLWDLETKTVTPLTELPSKHVRFSQDHVAVLTLGPSRPGARTEDRQSEDDPAAARLLVWAIADHQQVADETLAVAPQTLSVNHSLNEFAVGTQTLGIDLIDLASGELSMHVAEHANAVSFTAFTPDQDRIITGSWDGTIQIHSTTGRRLETLTDHESAVLCGTLSPDGTILISGDLDGRVIQWSVEEGQKVRELGHFAGAIQTLEFLDDGFQFISTCGDGTARIWDLRGNDPRVFESEGGVFAADVTADGQHMLLIPGEERFELREDPRRRIKGSVHRFTKAASTADAILFDLADGQKHVLEQEGQTIAGRIAPDGKHIVLLTSRGRVDVIDSSNRQAVRSIEIPRTRILAVAFGDSNDELYTLSKSGVAVWSVSSGEQLLAISEDIPVRFTAMDARSWNPISPDGEWIITAGRQAARWPLHPLEFARARAPRELTDREKSQFRVDLLQAVSP